MKVRNHLPGDEASQARVYNAAAAHLPAFKPAAPAEIAKRQSAPGFDPATHFYAVEGGEVVGYAVFHPNGRVSAPWALPGSEAVRAPLFNAVLSALDDRGVAEAWAAYRADWLPVLALLREHAFEHARDMVNYLAPLDGLPDAPAPAGLAFEPAAPDDLPALASLSAGLIDARPGRAAPFFFDNPYFGPECLFVLRDRGTGAVAGAALVIGRQGYADPAALDAAMPCFRLGAFGTEGQKHKRIDGMVSCVFRDEGVGTALLAEAARRLRAAGLAHAAAQGPDDRPGLLAFYDRWFPRQGAFPILARRPL